MGFDSRIACMPTFSLRLAAALAGSLLLAACASTPRPTPVEQLAARVSTATPVPPAPPLAAGQHAVLPAGQLIRLELRQEIHTGRIRPTDQFPLRVAEAVVVDGHTLVPAGAPALGEAIHVQKPGMFGKAAELLLTVRWVEVDGQRIATRHFRPLTGKDHENAAFALGWVPVAGWFSPFIRGGHIVLPAGSIAGAQVASDTPLTGVALAPATP
jgi:hypothetical protein